MKIQTKCAHAPWASYNTPWIELTQYGRRIGKKVYGERFERAWSSAVKRKSIISVHRSNSDSKWGSIFVTYRIKHKVLFFKIKEAIKRAWSVSRLFTKRTIFAHSLIQLFRERLSGKVHATILKGIVGGFEFSCFQRNLKELARKAMNMCLRVLKESNKSSLRQLQSSGTVYWSYPIFPFEIVACTFLPTKFLEIAVYKMFRHFRRAVSSIFYY